MKKYSKNCPALGLLALLVALSGCATSSTPQGAAMSMPERYTLPEVRTEEIKPAEGSLFSDKSMDLYRDSRASRIGDIVLVEIVETSSGKKEARTKTERESNIAGGVTSLFGFARWLNSKNPNFVPSATSLQADLINDFEGTGETERNSTVTATLSARIIDKTLEGNLVIRGFREVRVNNETQFIILSGIVRPGDISPNNSIQSTHIADARIEYSGSGVLSEKQQPGWLARGLDMVWPF